MKKKDLILDFTSLLDVIMIILFVVMGNAGQAAIDTKEKMYAQMEKMSEVYQELDSARRNLVELKRENEGVVLSNEKLQKQLKRISSGNNANDTEEDVVSANEGDLYEKIMNGTKKITLICMPRVNSDVSDRKEVEITLYSGDVEQEVSGVVIFTHEFDLTKEERAIRNAKMQADLYGALEKIVKSCNLKYAFITVEYAYDDKDFSQADLNNIVRAVDDIERNYSIKCYMEKVRR